MSYRLRRPFITEDSRELLNNGLMVERIALDMDGRPQMQGRVMNSDGSKGAVRTFMVEPWHVANMAYVLACGYRGMMFVQDIENPWAELDEKIRKRSA